MADRLHKKVIRETFSEQVKFGTLLLKASEEDEENEEDSMNLPDENEEDPIMNVQQCDCPATEFETIKVDTILPDTQNKISFGTEVSMNKATVTSLFLNETPFARFDSEANKLIIG